MDKEFKKKLTDIALPITVQTLMHSSLSLIDQIMIGSLGSACIAGIGLAGKFTSLFSVTVSAIVAAAGILISQYVGAKNERGVRDSFYLPLYFSLIFVVGFTLASLFAPNQIMAFYADDSETISKAALYLRWRAAGYFPEILTMFVSTLLRNMNRAKLPAVAGVVAIITNTLLNWLLIFGIGPLPRMEESGAAIATVLSHVIEMLIVVALFIREKKKQNLFLHPALTFSREFVKNAAFILAPILVGEFLWSLGENMYAVIYGHLGTEPCAAMTLMYPIQGIAIGALCGVSSASGIIVGNSLGANDEKKAWSQAIDFVRLTVTAGIIIGLIVCLLSPLYVKLFNVAPETRAVTVKILAAFAFVFTAKVFNMVIGGGVLQSGGQTKFMTAVNIIGTWGAGVPLGFATAYFFKLPIWWVYFFLSLEEFVRVGISIWLLKSRRWMKNVAV
ncbi:MATE family efflux transporter [Treponema ruminis]|uniref:Multidrug-efflux transporter n=1 Tax=Treponema ruminis TaxID=744515 RepID=A0A7W8G737_9SPIR|nr:MATE family efflux transporter [Treponema ruminis]MBB5225098.1 putative MATE family efflux protein [Treponema ruminis]QSI01019.1 MATE family efflux transporter [Treponema ruminis]